MPFILFSIETSSTMLSRSTGSSIQRCVLLQAREAPQRHTGNSRPEFRIAPVVDLMKGLSRLVKPCRVDIFLIL